MKFDEFEDLLNNSQLKEIANLNKKKLILKNSINSRFFIYLFIWLLSIFILFFIGVILEKELFPSALIGLVGTILIFDVLLVLFLPFLFFGHTLVDKSSYRTLDYNNNNKKRPVILSPNLKKRIESFILECKTKLFKSILELIIDELEYYPNQFFKYKVVKESQLFREFSYDSLNDEKCEIKIKGGDFVNGLFDNNPIEFCELDLTYIDRNGSETKAHTMFHGLFLIADVDKNFKSKTIIKAVPLVLGGFDRFLFETLNPNPKTNRWKNISVQNLLFNKHYVVSGIDEIETRKILSPIVLENLANFAEKYPKDILISFINNKMYFALSMGSFLDPDLSDLIRSVRFNKNLLKNDAYKIYEEIDLAINILNDLRLNSRKKNYLS